MASDREAGRVLKAKYLDWCSARLAERFLRLTPAEIYELAQQASAEAERGSGSPGVGTELSYRELVARVAGVLTEANPLPSFEVWLAAYEESPERIEEELLGFWKEES